jgi:hypothetical protein
MAESTRWHVIPKTKPLCYLGLVVGILLFVPAVWTLNTESVRVPALEVAVAVIAVILAACSIIGLVSPRLRGR